MLAEPFGTQQQDTVTIADMSVERLFRSRRRRGRLSAQIDFYNLFNANPEDFITWASGASYLRPSSVIPPRILGLASSSTGRSPRWPLVRRWLYRAP